MRLKFSNTSEHMDDFGMIKFASETGMLWEEDWGNEIRDAMGD